jgi:hypothetical protein
VALQERRILLRASKANHLRTIPINDTLLRERRKLPRHLQSDYLFWNRYQRGKHYTDDVREAFEMGTGEHEQEMKPG